MPIYLRIDGLDLCNCSLGRPVRGATRRDELRPRHESDPGMGTVRRAEGLSQGELRRAVRIQQIFTGKADNADSITLSIRARSSGALCVPAFSTPASTFPRSRPFPKHPSYLEPIRNAPAPSVSSSRPAAPCPRYRPCGCPHPLLYRFKFWRSIEHEPIPVRVFGRRGTVLEKMFPYNAIDPGAG